MGVFYPLRSCSSAGIVFTPGQFFGLSLRMSDRHVAPIKAKFGREELIVGLLLPA